MSSQSPQAAMYSSTDKILSQGVASLTDAELVATLLDDIAGGAELSQRIVDEFQPLSTLSTIELSRLRMVEGIGVKRAARVLCAIELGRRCHNSDIAPAEQIKSSSDIVAMFKPHMSNLNHEECWVLYLNTSNRVVEQQRISQGGINSTIIDHRLVIKRALELLATQIVLVHNHPSGDVTPSSEDIEMTRRIEQAATLFDITLLDHIIISHLNEYSMLSGGDIKK